MYVQKLYSLILQYVLYGWLNHGIFLMQRLILILISDCSLLVINYVKTH